MYNFQINTSIYNRRRILLSSFVNVNCLDVHAGCLTTTLPAVISADSNADFERQEINAVFYVKDFIIWKV